jgi:large subunit ribosomal protein L4
MIAAALRGALSDRAREGRVHVVSDLVGAENPSTRTVLKAISFATTSDKVLVVLGRDEDAAWLSLRNVASAHALAVDQLNAYDVLVNDEIVFTTTALDAFIAGPVAGRSAKAVASESEADLDADLSNSEEAAASTVTVEVDPTESVVVESSDASLVQPGDTVIVDSSEDEVVDPSEDDLADSSEDDLVEPSTAELAAEADGTDVEETK